MFPLFTAGIVDTGGAPWLANISAYFRKILNDPNAIIRGLGEDDSQKNQKKKSRDIVTDTGRNHLNE